MIVFVILITGFSVGFHIAFGSSNRQFMNFPSSALSLLLLSLGDFDAEKLRQENPVLGMVLFTMYAVTMVFVLLTMMLKIVDNAFHDMRAAMYDTRSKRENLALQMRLALQKVIVCGPPLQALTLFLTPSIQPLFLRLASLVAAVL